MNLKPITLENWCQESDSTAVLFKVHNYGMRTLGKYTDNEVLIYWHKVYIAKINGTQQKQ